MRSDEDSFSGRPERVREADVELSPYDIVSTSTVYNYFLRREIERISDIETATYYVFNSKSEDEARQLLSNYTPPSADHVINLEQRGFAVAHPSTFEFFRARTPGAVCAICDHDLVLGPEDYLFHVQPSQQPPNGKSVKVTWAASPEHCYPGKNTATLNLLVDHRTMSTTVIERQRCSPKSASLRAPSRKGSTISPTCPSGSSCPAGSQRSTPITSSSKSITIAQGSPSRRRAPYRQADIFFVTKAESMGLSVLECAMSGALVVVPRGYVNPHLLEPLNHVVWDDRIDWELVIAKLDAELSASSAARFNWQHLATLMINKLRLHSAQRQTAARAVSDLSGPAPTNATDRQSAPAAASLSEKPVSSTQQRASHQARAADNPARATRTQDMIASSAQRTPERRSPYAPFTDTELMRAFNTELSTAKHLLTIHSLAVGLNAQTIIDLGIGNTTEHYAPQLRRLVARSTAVTATRTIRVPLGRSNAAMEPFPGLLRCFFRAA